MSLENIGNVMWFVINREISSTLPSKTTKDEMLSKMSYNKIISYITNPQYTMTAAQAISSFGLTGKNYTQCNHTFCLRGDESVIFDNKLRLGVDSAASNCGFSHFRNLRGEKNTKLTQGITEIYANIVDNSIVFNVAIIEMVYSDLTPEFYADISNYRLASASTAVEKKPSIFCTLMINVFFNHFRETNNILCSVSENKRVFEEVTAICKDYRSHKMILQPSYIRTELYKYQKANINWMIERESRQEKFIMDDINVIQFNDKQFCLGHCHNSHVDHKIHGFTERFTVKSYAEKFGEHTLKTFRGGCLCDDVGLGKTVQIYTLCLMGPKTQNLIIVPEHLHSHWTAEFKKHIDTTRVDINFVCDSSKIKSNRSDGSRLIYLTTHSKLNDSAAKYTWDRVIIDEFHELFTSSQTKGKSSTDTTSQTNTNSRFDTILAIKATNRWAVTATPFINDNMLFNLLNFISDVGGISPDIVKYSRHIETFSKMCRRNTKSNVTDDVNLPQIKEETYTLEFSDKERTYYDSLGAVGTEDITIMQRKTCINPNLIFTEHSGIKNMNSRFVSIDNIGASIKNAHRDNYRKKEDELHRNKEKFLIAHFSGTTINKYADILRDDMKDDRKAVPSSGSITSLAAGGGKGMSVDTNVGHITIDSDEEDEDDGTIARKLDHKLNHLLGSLSSVSRNDSFEKIVKDESDKHSHHVDLCHHLVNYMFDLVINKEKPLKLEIRNGFNSDQDKNEIVKQIRELQGVRSLMNHFDEKLKILKKQSEDYIKLHPDYNKKHLETEIVYRMISDDSAQTNKSHKIGLLNSKSQKVSSSSTTSDMKFKLTSSDSDVDSDSDSDSDSDDEDVQKCGICLDKIGINSSLLSCGHIYCTTCIEALIRRGTKDCSICKTSFNDSTIYTLAKSSVSKFSESIDRFGTKIFHMMNLLKKHIVGKTIIFSCWPTLLENITEIMNENGVNALMPSRNDEIHDMINILAASDEYKVLVLSSDCNASGLNITCVQNIIFLEPIVGTYEQRKQIENQAIGRMHRIGQKASEVKIYRLIMQNSIESSINRENKINDTWCYENPFVVKSTKTDFVI